MTNASGQEIEVKFYVGDLEAFAKQLTALEAKQEQPRTHEYNLRFDTPNGALTRQHRVLRLRRDEQIRLTYKGPSDTSSGASAREEIEFAVEDFAAAQQLLEALGYQVSVIYEKYRTTYTLDNLHITLDELPIGNFVEIEGPDAEIIQAAAEKLGLDWGARILVSYLALFERVKGKLGLKIRDLTFENFAGIEIALENLTTDKHR